MTNCRSLKAMNSFTATLVPSRRPKIWQSCQPSTPIIQETGAMIHPNSRPRERLPSNPLMRARSPIHSPSEPRGQLTRATSPMNAINMATTLSHSLRPSLVPLAAASITLPAVRSTFSSTFPPVDGSSLSGSMILAIRNAAGADSTEAVRRWGPISGPRMPMYTARTEPAMVANPPVIIALSSDEVNLEM